MNVNLNILPLERELLPIHESFYGWLYPELEKTIRKQPNNANQARSKREKNNKTEYSHKNHLNY